MNAYEFAGKADNINTTLEMIVWVREAQLMLLEQAKRIDKLESVIKVNQECRSTGENEPVAWLEIGADGIASEYRVLHHSKPSKLDSWSTLIPLYTHQGVKNDR